MSTATTALRELARRAEDIFALEMKLRRVLTLIYLHANQAADAYNLLADESIQLPGKERPTPEHMKRVTENEFFHLTFRQYVGLNTRPNLNLPTLLELIHDQHSYEEFRDELTRAPIAHEDDAVFLAGLKERMDAIESMRNCVAHNRRPSRSTSQNYENARPLLERLLNDYLTRWEPPTEEAFHDKTSPERSTEQQQAADQ